MDPSGQETAAEVTIDPGKFHEVFAFDLCVETQRPDGRYPAPPLGSWRSQSQQEFRPGRSCHPGRWSLAATKWLAPMPSVRWPIALAKITEVEGSHVIMVSQPQTVTDVILTALAAAPQKEVLPGGR